MTTVDTIEASKYILTFILYQFYKHASYVDCRFSDFSAKINTTSFLHNIHTTCAHNMTTVLLFDYSQTFV